MPVYDRSAAGVYTQAGPSAYDKTAAGVLLPLGKMYDKTAAGAHSEVWTSSYTITLTNHGAAAGWKQSWSDSSSYIWYTSLGVGVGRCWVYFYGGGWAYGNALTSLVYGPNTSSWVTLLGEWDLSTYPGGSGWRHMRSYSGIVSNGTSNLYLRCSKINASQGGYGVDAQVMLVPLAPIENAIGRNCTAAEAAAWVGTGWAGSRVITITP